MTDGGMYYRLVDTTDDIYILVKADSWLGAPWFK